MQNKFAGTKESTYTCIINSLKNKNMKVANKNASALIEQLKPFQGNNTSAEIETSVTGLKLLVVYSFNEPIMFSFQNGETIHTYITTKKFSRTTSKHVTQLTPNGGKTYVCDLRKVLEIITTK